MLISDVTSGVLLKEGSIHCTPVHTIHCFVDDFKCPITQQTMVDPVVASGMVWGRGQWEGHRVWWGEGAVGGASGMGAVGEGHQV